MQVDISKLLDTLIQSPENEVVEFKEAKKTFDSNDLGKYFSALSNEANLHDKEYAWLIFGVADKTKALVNTQYKNTTKSLNLLKNEIAQHTTEKHTFFEIHEVFKDNNRILLFQILPAPKGTPIAWKNVRYGRNGESLCVLSDAKLEKIKNQTLNDDWSAEIVPHASIADLDPEAIAKARSNFRDKKPKLAKQIDAWDDITFLNKAKITIKGKITNAAIILLGKEESEALISPAVSKIRWILKDSRGMERDYLIRGCPLLLSIEQIYRQIRNLKYRYINPYFKTLFPQELDTYDPYIIREAINNAIAHQDYRRGGMINVVEFDDKLVFSNQGSFLPESIQAVIRDDAPAETYRNYFLAQAMVGLNMVDTIGSGIKKMFELQLERLFPMPNYDLASNKVQVTIFGHVLNNDFSVLLTKHKDLTLPEIEMLNRVLFKKPLSQAESLWLRKKKLIEGRMPNIYLAKAVAEITGRKAEYTKNKGFNDEYYKDLILKALNEHVRMTRKEIEELLQNKLPDILDEQQKFNKIKNLLTSLRSNNQINYSIVEKVWVLV